MSDDAPNGSADAPGTSDGGPSAPDGGPGAADDADPTTGGAGGARRDATAGGADHAVTGETPLEAAAGTSGVRHRLRAWYEHLTREERYVGVVVAGFAGLLALAVLVGFIKLSYLLFLLSLAGMYMLLSLGLNVQWGYTGLINFSVAAFFGVGAYATMLLASGDSPLVTGDVPVVTWPVAGLVLSVLAGAALAVLIGVPTLSLQDDYLAIATLGLAEVVRLVVLNQREWTDGSAGIVGLPRFFESWPYVGDLVAGVDEMALNLLTVVAFLLVVWLFLRRVHRSPWGRVQRVIRADVDLAEALGKDTFAFRMQSFVVGSAIMALAGAFYVHLNNSIFPSNLAPIQTFYVWIAVILGGTGSDRGAMLGGIVIITIVEGTRFLGDEIVLDLLVVVVTIASPVDPGPLRLFLVGATIILVMYARPQGVLPPQRELIWPGARGGSDDE